MYKPCRCCKRNIIHDTHHQT